MGERNEEMARALVAQLRAAGIDARVSGSGVEWHVDAGVEGSRTLHVRCVRYREGSERPHRTFTDLVVEDPAGQRRCIVAGTYVRFDAEGGLTSASWPTREHAARAIRRYCEAREPAADISADPATVVVMRDGKTIKGGDW